MDDPLLIGLAGRRDRVGPHSGVHPGGPSLGGMGRVRLYDEEAKEGNARFLTWVDDRTRSLLVGLAKRDDRLQQPGNVCTAACMALR
jgi:hypothetical protein